MTKTTFPKWSTPARREYLVKLWSLYGNQCLLGHTACPNLEHYIHYDSNHVPVKGGKPVLKVNQNQDGQSYFEMVYPIVDGEVKTRRVDRLYELKSEKLIKDWISLDRSEAMADYQAEFEARHQTNDRTFPLHGKFSGISKDIYYDQQSLFYVEAIGISGLNQHPFAKVRLASSNIRLFVDLAPIISKNQKHKLIRYGKLNWNLQNKIDTACYQVVRHHLDNL